MTRRLALFVVVVALVLGLARMLFHGRRTLQLARGLVSSVEGEGNPNDALAAWMTSRPLDLRGCERDPDVCRRFHDLLATMAVTHDGRLPDGLQFGTVGPIDWKTADSWLNAASVVFADRAQVSDTTCLEALTFSAFLARHGGADGEKVASRLMLLALPECARLTPSVDLTSLAEQRRAWLVGQTGPMLEGFALDGQLRRFGSWLGPDDLAALPAGMRALALTAPPPPFNPIERNARAAMWQRAAEFQQQFKATFTTARAGTAEAAALIDEAVKQWPERVSDPKRLRQAYDEERVRVAATELLLDAWEMKPGCELGTQATSTARPDGEECLLTNQNLHVQLPSRKE